jgi:hypothetical protein
LSLCFNRLDKASLDLLIFPKVFTLFQCDVLFHQLDIVQALLLPFIDLSGQLVQLNPV